MRTFALVLVSGLFAGLVPAQSSSVKISIGVRETGAGGNPNSTIGSNGGFGGSIEWINRDGQTLVLDGSWQTFAFTIATDPITAFAGGSTLNGVIDGMWGTFEHIRVLNDNGITAPITLMVDEVVNITTTLGSVTVTDFELFQQGDEVMFQDPGFSGSTSGNVMGSPNSRGIENGFTSPTPGVYRFEFQFVDGATNRWVRLTSFNTANVPNPVVRFDDNSVITFRLAGFTECGADLGSQGPGTAMATLCGSGLNANEAMTFAVSGAPASTFGAIGASFSNFPDLPLFGGNLVSGTGLFLQFPLFTDPSGYAALTFNGDATLLDLTFQGAFIDTSLPTFIAFTNATEGFYGQ